MKRIMVVGTSCSGKTTLARSIAEAMRIPHVELDVINWGPGWTERPPQAFREAVARAVEGERWVVDGNYSRVRDIVLARATDAIWLNYSFPLVFRRAMARTTRRVFLREELFGGNRETFRNAFLSRNSIPWWVVRTYRGRQQEYRRLFRAGDAAHVHLRELRDPGEALALLESIRGGATA